MMRWLREQADRLRERRATEHEWRSWQDDSASLGVGARQQSGSWWRLRGPAAHASATKRGWLLSAILTTLLVALTVSSLFALRAMQGGGARATSGASGSSGIVASHADAQLRRSPTATASPTTTASTPPTSGRTSNGCAITSAQANAELYLLNLLNRHRAAAGVPPLILNQTLSRASRAHSCDMFLHQKLNHFGSDGSTPQQRIAATGLAHSTWAENIGYTINSGLINGINRTDAAMMSEPDAGYDHHYNIVNPANTQVGLGVIYANGQMWMTEDFIG